MSCSSAWTRKRAATQLVLTSSRLNEHELQLVCAFFAQFVAKTCYEYLNEIAFVRSPIPVFSRASWNPRHLWLPSCVSPLNKGHSPHSHQRSIGFKPAKDKTPGAPKSSAHAKGRDQGVAAPPHRDEHSALHHLAQSTSPTL